MRAQTRVKKLLLFYLARERKKDERRRRSRKNINMRIAHIPILSCVNVSPALYSVHHTGNMKCVSAGFYLVISFVVFIVLFFFFYSLFLSIICYEISVAISPLVSNNNKFNKTQ